MYLTDEQHEFFIENKNFIYYLAKKLSNVYYSLTYDELVALISFGVMKAVKHFKPESGNKFSTFANTCAENEIRMELRKQITRNKLKTCNLEDKVSSKGDNLTIADAIGDERVDVEASVEARESIEIMYQCLISLPDRERRIFMHKHTLKGYAFKTQAELAEMFGISQSYVSRIIDGIEKDIKGAIERNRRKPIKTAGTNSNSNPSLLEPKLNKKRTRRGNSKSCVDHLGNSFDSLKLMVQHYGISLKLYYNRKCKGLTLEECLAPVNSMSRKSRKTPKVIKDHLGKTFTSVSVMLKYHEVNTSTYYRKKKEGLTLEECLTKQNILKSEKLKVDGGSKKSSKIITDHNGNTFNSVGNMLKHYGATPKIYYSGKKKGYPLEVCLGVACLLLKYEETGTGNSKPCKDHLGNKFPSKKAMINYHGVKEAVFDKRRKKGFSLKDCLSPVPLKRKGGRVACTDHLGDKYDSVTAMLNHYDITKTTYYKRKKQGLTLEECLTTPLENRGNETKPKQDTSTIQGVTKTTTQGKTGDFKDMKNSGNYTDHNGRVFKSIKDMIKYHGIPQHIYYYRKSQGRSLEECLSPKKLIPKSKEVIPKQNSTVPKTGNNSSQDNVIVESTQENNTSNNSISKTISTNETKNQILNIVYEGSSARVTYLDETTNTVKNRYISYSNPVWHSCDIISSTKFLILRGIEVVKIFV